MSFKIPVENRFWDKVDKKEGDGCWEWQAAIAKTGYGVINVGRKTTKAHRVSWELVNGSIPAGMMVCHKCDNRICVRPDHLFLGDSLANNLDMTLKERHGRMRFTHSQVERIRALYDRHRDHLSHERIAKWFGVSKATISHMMTGRNWRNADGEHQVGIWKRRYNTKLKAEQVKEMKARRKQGEKLASLGISFGLCESSVSKICRGKRYLHVCPAH